MTTKTNNQNKHILDTYMKHEKNIRVLTKYASARLGKFSTESGDFVIKAYLQAVCYTEPIENPEAFLKTVIRCRIYDYFKNQKKKSKDTQNLGKQLTEELIENVSSGTYNPLDYLCDREEQQYNSDKWSIAMAHIYAPLSSQDKNLLRLRFKEGMSWKEVADELGISCENARTKGSRLSKRIKTEYQNYKNQNP